MEDVTRVLGADAGGMVVDGTSAEAARSKFRLNFELVIATFFPPFFPYLFMGGMLALYWLESLQSKKSTLARDINKEVEDPRSEVDR